MTEEGWLTVRQVELMLGISRQRVHQLLEAGKLEGVSRYAPVSARLGDRVSQRRQWLVSLASVEARLKTAS